MARRIQVLDQVECVGELEEDDGLYTKKGTRYFVREVTDAPLWYERIVGLVLSGHVPTMDDLTEREYGIRVIGITYPNSVYHRASDFKLVNVLLPGPVEIRDEGPTPETPQSSQE